MVIQESNETTEQKLVDLRMYGLRIARTVAQCRKGDQVKCFCEKEKTKTSRLDRVSPLHLAMGSFRAQVLKYRH